jgi:transposase
VVADDTTLPVLDPGRGRTKTGRLWCYVVDNRPWSGPGHPAAAYAYSEDRKGEHPATHLKGFRGLLQVDGYAGFGGLVTGAANDAPTLAFCWTHTRRKFYDVHAATNSPLAHEALQRIGALYAIEADIRGQTAEQRQQVRQQRSRPLVEALHTWKGVTMAASNWIQTSSSAPCAPWLSAETMSGLGLCGVHVGRGHKTQCRRRIFAPATRT